MTYAPELLQSRADYELWTTHRPESSLVPAFIDTYRQTVTEIEHQLRDPAGIHHPYAFGRHRMQFVEESLTEYLTGGSDEHKFRCGMTYLGEIAATYLLSLLAATHDQGLEVLPSPHFVDSSIRVDDPMAYQKGGDCVIGSTQQTAIGTSVIEPHTIVDVTCSVPRSYNYRRKRNYLGYNGPFEVPVVIMSLGNQGESRMIPAMRSAIQRGEYPYFPGFSPYELHEYWKRMFERTGKAAATNLMKLHDPNAAIPEEILESIRTNGEQVADFFSATDAEVSYMLEMHYALQHEFDAPVPHAPQAA